jgi:PhoPQ-activated pathogenicity-related protein
MAKADDRVTDREDTPKALQRYVQLADEVFKWDLVNTVASDLGRVYELRVTSQKWQGIVWKHAVEVYEPKRLRFPGHALLFVTGGSRPSPPSANDMTMGIKLATACGARVVMLHQTPNQPLLGNRHEDDLISETWLRYLDTGDESWPLLFPMVKSAIRTMDAVEEFSQDELDEKISQFIITGASKRGWTSWLTPVADQRVIGTAPIVIDVLNFRAQMNHQLETWGDFSRQIIDYTSKGLVKRPGEVESDREAALRTMMDPFTYRKRLTLPKLLIVGTNDPYWVVDAMNLYWDDLEGGKFIRQIPNAGHGLEGGRENAFASLAVFFQHVVAGKSLPELSWEFEENGRQVTLDMSTTAMPRAVRLWSARSEDKDFRDAHWRSSELEGNGSRWTGSAKRSPADHVAVFGEFEFDFGGLPWSLTTLVYRR